MKWKSVVRTAALCLLALWLQGAACLQAQVNPQFDVFVQAVPSAGGAIPGQTEDVLYSGWMKVLSFEAGVDNASALSQVPVPGTFREFTLVKTADSSTLPLFEHMATRTRFSSMKIVIVAKTGRRTELWEISGSTCFVSKQSFSCNEGGEMEERLGILMGQLEWSYTKVNAAGDPLAEVFSNWSMLTQTGRNTSTRQAQFPGGTDTDSDGIPDGWELYYSLNRNVADPNLDSDGDGMTNLMEYIAHTDPTAASSAFRISSVQKPGTSSLTLSWESVAGLTYLVQSASSPAGPFATLQTVTSAGDETTSATVPTAGGRMFFRVLVQ